MLLKHLDNRSAHPMAHTREVILNVTPSMIRELGIEAAVVWAAVRAIRGIGTQAVLTIRNEDIANLLPRVEVSSLNRHFTTLMDAGYIQHFNVEDRKFRLFFPHSQSISSENYSQNSYVERGPAPVFGTRKSNLYRSDQEAETEIFGQSISERQQLIEMNYDWQPSPMFFEQLQTSKAKHVTQEQIKEQLSAFRIKYAQDKPLKQAKWDSKFLNWLIVHGVIEETSARVQETIYQNRTSSSTNSSIAASMLYDDELDQ